MPSFKVIVIGGGPVGLIAAHSLSKAGIDFVVLERRPNIVEDVGASLVLLASSLRVLGQLGLLDRTREVGHELLRWADYTKDGLTRESWYMYYLRANHGAFSTMIHRADFVQVLYEGLSDADRARIHTNKKLVGIESNSDGVVVRCEDGSAYEGSIVIGADGTHSPTRSVIRDLRPKADPGADVDEERPFSVQYRAMWCTYPRMYEYPPGEHNITHGEPGSLQFLNATDKSWVFVYEKLTDDEVAAATAAAADGRGVRYTEADMEAFAARYGEMRVGGKLKFKEFFPHRKHGGMANLEEGMVRRWSGGRVVLAGDAAHKYTVNAGLGLNSGIQDVVALVNELRRCAESVGKESLPGLDEVAGAFRRYEEVRWGKAKEDFDLSRHITRLTNWPSKMYWFFDQWVMGSIPYINEILTKVAVSPKIADGLCLDFVEGEEPFQGNMPWVHPVKKRV